MKFSKTNIGCLTLLFLPMMLAGLIFSYGTICSVIKAIDTNNWNKTRATIESLNVQTNRVGHETYTYKVFPVYTYSVNGKTYEGKKVAMGYGLRNKKVHHSIMEKMENAKSIMVYVNPTNPEDAVIIKGFNLNILWGFLISFVMGGTSLMMLLPLYIGRKDQQEMNQIFIKTSG